MSEEAFSLVRVLPCFTIGRAAMLAEPAVTNIEEVVGLIHGGPEIRGQKSEIKNQKSEIRYQKSESDL